MGGGAPFLLLPLAFLFPAFVALLGGLTTTAAAIGVIEKSISVIGSDLLEASRKRRRGDVSNATVIQQHC